MNYPLETRPLLIHRLGESQVNPGAGHCIYVMAVYLSVHSYFESGGQYVPGPPGSISLTIGGQSVVQLVGVDQSMVLPYNPRGWFKGAPGQTMTLLEAGGGNKQGVVWYTIMREPSADGVK